MSRKIESEKLFVKDVFQNFYKIPNYQRPYVWGEEQVMELLDDVYESAMKSQNFEEKSQYFIGSLVLHKNKKKENGIEFTEYDLLDGQQRLTTLLLITAVVRDLTPDTNEARIKSCKESIFRMAVPDDNIPERLRIVYDIRKEVSDFIETFVKTDGGTNKEDELIKLASSNGIDDNDIDINIKNMAKVILVIRKYFKDQNKLNLLFPYLRSQVLMIYVAADELDDAFRLFTIMNNRGVKLRSSDILKADNLAKVNDDDKRKTYAKQWEETENYFEDDFDNFLSHIRTILVKTKANMTLLKEFEENIYNPKSYDRKTKTFNSVPPLITKGDATFDFVKKHFDNYKAIFDKDHYALSSSFKFVNLLTIMNRGFEADYWVAPILRYYEKFKDEKLIEFLTELDKKFSADWITGLSPTVRIENVNAIIKAIDDTDNADDIFSSDKLKIAEDDFIRVITGDIYGKRFTRYILLKVEYLYHGHSAKISLPDIVSIEHILPQKPNDGSQWLVDYTEDERLKWTNKVGNLILLSRRKNSSQGNRDYTFKKDNYFKEHIDVFAYSPHVMRSSEWKIKNLKGNNIEVIKKLFNSYGIVKTDTEIEELFK